VINEERPAHRALEPASHRERRRSKRPIVLLVGNPNTGKTTLFNRLTGENAKVGNYPGITVERRSGKLELADEQGTTTAVELVDVPGCYSLSARSSEEQIALEAVLGLDDFPAPELVVAVVDAGQLVRNLYLVLQLAELRVPFVIALNMIDESGPDAPRPEAIARVFGVPCVATDARRGAGIDGLKRAVRSALASAPVSSVGLDYPDALRTPIDRVAEALPPAWRGSVERDRALAMWALNSVEEDDELTGIPAELRERCAAAREQAAPRDIDLEIIATRYGFLDQSAKQFYQRIDPHPPKRRLSQRIDRALLHPVFGFAIFILVMLVIFQSLFAWADPAIRLLEDAAGALAELARARLPEGFLRDLVSEGLIAGVGNVVVFLPQIALLFLFVGLLEDSGYMARVAFLMDRIMRALGLHGRAFVPMLSGFACAVPAILATRTMERRRDRLLTMLVIPLMTCSARLPVYTLIIAALFPPTLLLGWLPVQGLLMVAMYLFSIAITLIAAAVLGRTAVKGRRVPLILELPPYRMPNLRTIARSVWERSFVFLKEAGTVILVCTIVLWALLSYPKPDPAAIGTTAPESRTPSAEHADQALAIEKSFGGQLGKAIEPALEPLGFDWKIGVGIIGAFAAREVFVSTLGLVYGIGKVEDDALPLRERIKRETDASGRPIYTPLMGLSLMVFFAVACQCMSTLAVVRRETKTWRWPAFMLAYMTGSAYLLSLLVYQGGRMLGFS
jgi:ferrous iron transport protein B